MEERTLSATERLAKRLGRPNVAAVRPKQSVHRAIGMSVEKKQLELELQSLRETYAKKIAEKELAWEKKLQETEDEAKQWFKEKKVEIAKIKAGIQVMQLLFQNRKRAILKQLADERAEIERLRREMEERIAENERQMQETMENCEKRVVELVAAHEKQIQDLDKEHRSMEERLMKSERAVKLGDAEILRLQDVEKNLRFEIEDYRVRLQDSERAEELHRAKEKAEFLEEELRRTRERMARKRHLEAEELRKELMEYVKFIVKILPDEWQDRIVPELWLRVQAKHLPEVSLDFPAPSEE